jgi:membrane fusion protein (multidrug efflux system)
VVVALAGGCEKPQEKAPPPMDVLVTEVVPKNVPVFQDWIGTTSGFINAQIRPQVKGYLLTKNYKEGDVVRPGDLLFQIDPREFQAQLDQAQGDLDKAQAAQGRTQLDVNRYTPLAKEGAVSQQELDNAVQNNAANIAAVAAAKAAVAQARLNLGWTKVTSPIDGVSGIAIAQIGDLVDPTTKLTTVSQVDPIKAIFPVPEQGYLRYARAQAEGKDQYEQTTQKGALELILSDGTVFPHRGTVSVIGREVDPRTGTLTIEALFPNPGDVLRPGGYAKVRAVIDTLQNALVVPQAAVQNFQGTSQLAVVLPDNKVEIRNVTTGPRYGPEWVILDGVKAGERVVAEGLQKVRGGMTVNPKPYIAPTPEATYTPAPF